MAEIILSPSSHSRYGCVFSRNLNPRGKKVRTLVPPQRVSIISQILTLRLDHQIQDDEISLIYVNPGLTLSAER